MKILFLLSSFFYYFLARVSSETFSAGFEIALLFKFNDFIPQGSVSCTLLELFPYYFNNSCNLYFIFYLSFMDDDLFVAYWMVV